MNRRPAIARMIGHMALTAGLLIGLAGCKDDKADANRLSVFCAAGIRLPIDQLKEEFIADRPGVTVAMQFGGSGELLSQLELTPADDRPDVYIAGEESYAQDAQAKGLVDRIETLAYFVPVIAVARDRASELNIRTLADLARPGLKVALGEPRGPAVGKVSDRMLRAASLAAVCENAVAHGSTVQEMARTVMLGHADATIIWDATARQGDFAKTLTTIAIPGAPTVRIVICRVSDTPRAELADAFIDYVRTGDSSRAAFTKYGFTVAAPTTAPAP